MGAPSSKGSFAAEAAVAAITTALLSPASLLGTSVTPASLNPAICDMQIPLGWENKSEQSALKLVPRCYPWLRVRGIMTEQVLKNSSGPFVASLSLSVSLSRHNSRTTRSSRGPTFTEIVISHSKPSDYAIYIL